MTGDFTDHLLS